MADNNHSNAEDYINKLYDHTQDRQKQLLTDAFTANNQALDTQKQNVQQQTDTYTDRTDVEAQRVAQAYKPANVSAGVGQQAALAMQNQQKKNTAALRGEQQAADAEVERLRKLYADQFAAAIKQAQADNDMARAQMLYEAAKAKESELKAFTTQMGTLDNQAMIDKIYDSAIESGKQELAMEQAERMSELDAQQAANMRQTDRNLTQVYVDALKNSKNYNEVQNAYGLGSGNRAQAQLARDMGLTENLTELRRVQMAADAQVGQQRVETGKSFADAVADIVKSNEQKRTEALYREALTQQPKVAEGVYRKRDDGGNTGYNNVLNDIMKAKANGYYGGEIQAMINAAYKEGTINAAEKKELEKHRNGVIYAG